MSHLIRLVKGNIFHSSMQTITNPINCVGVMGGGLALEFKKQYPQMFDEYCVHCEQGRVKIGELYVHRLNDQKQILMFPTKDHYKDPSLMDFIYGGLGYLMQHKASLGVTSLALPALGCGLGGLSWDDVKPVLMMTAQALHMPVEIYMPWDAE